MAGALTRVELLYSDDCPGQEPLLARVRELVAQHSARAVIEAVRVASDDEAQARRFLGSPTLRVDGADVEPGADERRDYGLNCRLYRGASGLTGSPDDAWIVAALTCAATARGSRDTRDSARSAAALARIGLVPERSARVASLDVSHRSLYRRILAAFAAGEPPSRQPVRDWIAELGTDDDTALQRLRSADLIQLDESGAVAVAYPFSARPTRHRVGIERGPAVWAMCAIEVRVDPAGGAVSAPPGHRGGARRRPWSWLQCHGPLPVHQLLRHDGPCRSVPRQP